MSKDVESLWTSSATLQGLCWELKCGLRDRAVILTEIDRCISSMADEIRMLSQPECDGSETVVIPAPAAEAEIMPEISVQESEPEVESEVETETEPEQEPESHDEECLTQECQMTAESALLEEAADAEPEPQPEPIEPQVQELVTETVDTVQAEEPEPVAETVTETVTVVEAAPEQKPEPAEKPEEPQEKKPEPIPLDRKLSRKVMADIRKAFTVNDKFLFRRELFGNSAQQYDEAMNLISEMQSYEEARDYFFGQFGWDSDNNEVKRFMEILENHFNC